MLPYEVELDPTDYPLGAATMAAASLIVAQNFGDEPLLILDITTVSSANGQITDTGADGVGALHFVVPASALSGFRDLGPLAYEITVTDSRGLLATLDEGSLVATPSTAGLPVDHVTLTPSPVRLDLAQTQQMTATPFDINGTALVGRTITYQSSNAAVATVSPTGLVTGVAVGSAIITATAEGKSATATISVPAVDHIVLDPVGPISLDFPATQQMTATLYDVDGNVLSNRTIVWTSTDQNIVEVDSTGFVSAGDTGTASVTATVEGKSASAVVNATVPAPLTLTLDFNPLVRRTDLAVPLTLASNTGQTGSQDGIPQHLGAGQLNLGGGEARVEYPKSADEWGFVAPVDAAMASDVPPNVFHATSNVLIDGPYPNTAARSILPSEPTGHYATHDLRWHGLSSADNQDVSSFKRSCACAIIARTAGDVGKTVRINLIDQANDPGGSGWSGSVPVIKFVDVVLHHSLAEIDHTAATAHLWEHVALTFDNYAQIAALVGPPTLAITMPPGASQVVGYATAPYTHHAWQAEESDPSNWWRNLPFHEQLGVQSTDVAANCWVGDSDDPVLLGGAAKVGTAVAAPDSNRFYGAPTLKQFTLDVGDGITTAAPIRIEDAGDSMPTQSNIPVQSAWAHWYIEPAPGHTLPLDTDVVARLLAVNILGADTFTRGDSSSLTNAESGQAYVNGNLWGVSSGKVRCIGPAEHPAVMDCGSADGTAECVFSGTGLGSVFNNWLVGRYVDDSNFIFVSAQSANTVELYNFDGSFNLLGTAAYTWLGGENVKLVMAGPNLAVLIDDVQKITATSSAHQTATFHGWNGSSVAGTAARWDNFKFTGGTVTFGPFPLVSDATRYGLERGSALVRANGGQFFRAPLAFNLADEGYLDFTPQLVSTVPGLVFNAYRAAITTPVGRDLGVHNAWVPRRTVTARQFTDSAFEIIANIQKIMTTPTLLWMMRQVAPWSFGELANINGAGANSYVPSLWQSGPYGSGDYAFKCDVNQHNDGTLSISIAVARGFPTANPNDYMSWAVKFDNVSLAQLLTACPKFVAFDIVVAAQAGVPILFGIGFGTGNGITWLGDGDSYLGGTVTFEHAAGIAWTFDNDGIPGPDFPHMGLAADLDRVRQTNGWVQAIAASNVIDDTVANMKTRIAFHIAKQWRARKDHRLALP